MSTFLSIEMRRIRLQCSIDVGSYLRSDEDADDISIHHGSSTTGVVSVPRSSSTTPLVSHGSTVVS